MRRTTKPKVPLAPAAPVVVEPPRPKLFSYTRPASTSAHTLRRVIEDIEAGIYRVPAFQRDLVWADKDVLYFLDSIVRGFYFGSMIVWHRLDTRIDLIKVWPREGADVEHRWGHLLVVDGQQRLAAIGQALLTRRFAYDLQAQRFVVDVPESSTCLPLWRVAKGYADWQPWIDAGGAMDHLADLSDALLYREVPVVTLPYDWAEEQVVEMFRRLNFTGVPMALPATEVELATEDEPIQEAKLSKKDNPGPGLCVDCKGPARCYIRSEDGGVERRCAACCNLIREPCQLIQPAP